MRLIALDIDDTLAHPNEPISAAVVDSLCRLRESGSRLLLVSGKPAAYVAGVARQLGLGPVIIAGENGAVVASSHEFPPAWERSTELPEDARTLLADLARDVVTEFGDSVWLQPNRVNASVFWRDSAAKDAVVAFVTARMNDYDPGHGFTQFTHADCVEVVAPGVNKGAALRLVAEAENTELSDAVAVGDSANDLPMFQVAGLSIGIALDGGNRRFEDVASALDWLVRELAS